VADIVLLWPIWSVADMVAPQITTTSQIKQLWYAFTTKLLTGDN